MRITKLCEKYFFYFIMLLLVAGCTKGGGEGDLYTPSNVQYGAFLDSAVEGIEYSTPSWKNGITADGGTFVYQPGEVVTFSIGGVTLGTTRARRNITPIDLVPGATDASNSAVINMCRLLISLDEDMRPENGIAITPETREIMSRYSFGFNDPIDENPVVQSLFAELNDNGIAPEDTSGNIKERVIVSEEVASVHFENTLIELEQELLAEENLNLLAIIARPLGNALMIEGQYIPVQAYVEGGEEPYYYEWKILDQNDDHLSGYTYSGFISLPGNSPPVTISGLAPGNYTLLLSIIDSDGTPVSSQSYITVLDNSTYPIPTGDRKVEIYLNRDEYITASLGQSINIKAQITNGNPPFYYMWNYPDSVIYSFKTDPLDAVFTFNSKGLQTILFIVTKDSINNDQDQVAINVNVK